MARKSKTPAARGADVRAAFGQLGCLIAAAEDAERYAYDSSESLAAWKRVEEHGATIHRQARLLAGKSRAGAELIEITFNRYGHLLPGHEEEVGRRCLSGWRRTFPWERIGMARKDPSGCGR